MVKVDAVTNPRSSGAGASIPELVLSEDDGARDAFLFNDGGDGGFPPNDIASISISLLVVEVDIDFDVVEGDPVDAAETSRVANASVVIVVKLLLFVLFPPSAAIRSSFTRECGSNSCTLFQTPSGKKG